MKQENKAIMESIPNFGEKLAELSIRRSNEFKSFIRQILVICSSILGILVAFKGEKISDLTELYLFIITIGLLGLNILTGLIVLYSEIHTLDKLRNALVDTIEQWNKGDRNVFGTIVTPKAKIFSKIEYIFYMTFGLAICSIVVYSCFAFS